jgi:hypothetical protein
MSTNRLSRLLTEQFALNLDVKNDLIQPDQSRADSVFSSSSVLTPDLKAEQTPSLAPPLSDSVATTQRIGNYLLIPRSPTTTLSSSSSSSQYEAVDIVTGQHFTCKLVPLRQYQGLISLYSSVLPHPNILPLHLVLLGSSSAYLLQPKHYGDLHSYVRSVKRLGEAEAKRLFAQIVCTVEHCHERGIVLRDIKLRKFVFKDESRFVFIACYVFFCA